MASIFKPSRIIAVALIVGAAAWIYTGQLAPRAEQPAAASPPAKSAPAEPVQRVGITTAVPEKHQQQIILSCTTQADRRAWATARIAGIVVDLKAKRGSAIRAGDLIAKISDEGREAMVRQARALL